MALPYADEAQMVERLLGMQKAVGSTPIIGLWATLLGKLTGLQTRLDAGFDSSVACYESVAERQGVRLQP